MAFDESMQQIVEETLEISPETDTTPTAILDAIASYFRSNRNITVDRVAFEECVQGSADNFKDFYIRLHRLAKMADLCAECLETRIATRIMAGWPGSATRKEGDTFCQ